ncbi:IPT/TIG domain-containing protein [Cognataquiflexum aquatile]|uniref:IPT/TIG domain-containing protein n=1 Tax=Cognataquiflexum aquatile TaxID=2249427 RepID=UPI000DE8B317|nr:IPT/TIG domain-containing protein [Cognataquiflexum aquatile]
MKYTIRLIVVLLVSLLQGCTIDSNISERDYPVIKSLGIKDLDETGVDIDFMIIQKPSVTIDTYGIQYRKIGKGSPNIPEYFFYEEVAGKPLRNPITIRLQYDLEPGVDYFARPFVRSGSQMIFGESFNFSSLGVKGPEITSVSESQLSQYHTLTIAGNYFSRKPENNILDFGGIEEYFNIKIMEATPTKLVVELLKNFNTIPDLDRKFNLKITVNGKSGVLNDAFEVIIPKILKVEPSELFVNDTIKMDLNFSNESGLQFTMIDQAGTSYLLPTTPSEGFIAKGAVPNLPPGKYKVKVGTSGFDEYTFPQEITIKNSWAFGFENIPLVDPNKYSFISAGNQIVTYNYTPFFDLYSFDLNNPNPLKFGDFPENGRERERYALHYSKIDGKIYFGLGARLPTLDQPRVLYTDFYRYDILSKKQEKLTDLPEGLTAVQWTFDYLGKVAIAFLFRPNFHFFNTAQNTWEDTGVEVPFDLQDAVAVTSKGGKIYFLRVTSNFQTLYLLSLQIGQSPVLISQIPISGLNTSWEITEFENSIYFGSGTSNIFEYNIAEDNVLRLQSIYSSPNQKAKFYQIGSHLYYGLPSYAGIGENRLFKLLR